MEQSRVEVEATWEEHYARHMRKAVLAEEAEALNQMKFAAAVDKHLADNKPPKSEELIMTLCKVGMGFGAGLFVCAMLFATPAEAEGTIDYWAAQAERDRTYEARKAEEEAYEERMYWAEEDHKNGYENDNSYHDLDEHNDRNQHDY